MTWCSTNSWFRQCWIDVFCLRSWRPHEVWVPVRLRYEHDGLGHAAVWVRLCGQWRTRFWAGEPQVGDGLHAEGKQKFKSYKKTCISTFKNYLTIDGNKTVSRLPEIMSLRIESALYAMEPLIYIEIFHLLSVSVNWTLTDAHKRQWALGSNWRAIRWPRLLGQTRGVPIHATALSEDKQQQSRQYEQSNLIFCCRHDIDDTFCLLSPCRQRRSSCNCCCTSFCWDAVPEAHGLWLWGSAHQPRRDTLPFF